MFGKNKRYTILIVAVLVVVTVIILFAPIIPVESTITQTRTKKLLYDAGVYGIANVPKVVKVTNKDSISGSFSVEMSKWYNRITLNGIQKELDDSTTQSLVINAGETGEFNLPEDWIIIEPMHSFTYSVTAPTKQENYDVAKTEYRSIISVITNP